MKRLFLLLIVICLPLIADEVWLGMVAGATGDSLILVDGPKVYVPGLSLGRYVNEDDQAIDPGSIKFPFTASLVVPDQNFASADETAMRILLNRAYIKIHKFYDVVNGRLLER
ncbi:MAG: hypothetical protein ACUVTF_01270 [bacterium]